LVIEALSTFVQPHLWRGELAVYPVMTTPQENGGWGHLMPFWFKPQERPVPFYTLNNWALFALVYAHSFGPSNEARRLVEQVFTVENVVQVVVGTNLQLPFLPTTQGRGSFFRQGMFPFLLSMFFVVYALVRGGCWPKVASTPSIGGSTFYRARESGNLRGSHCYVD
jgi:hypothetical protein